MLLSIFSRSRGQSGRRAAAARFAVSALALALGPSVALMAPPPAFASDLDVLSSGGAEVDGHFLRLGLGKSAVIKLPAEVKDVVVGDPTVVDVVIRNKSTAYLFGRSAAQTNIFFFDANGGQILQLDLEVTLDSKGLQKLLDRTLPRTKIKADTVGKNIVLKGTAVNAAEAKLALDLATASIPNASPESIVNAMTIAEGDQVMLKVHVVEMQRDVVKALGVNLKAALSSGSFAMGLGTANPILGSFLGAGASYNGKNFSVDAAIDAMESDGVIRTLAEPTLTAISGQRAQFLAGGQFPYITGYSCDTGGTNCVRNVTYKDFGVKLGFTPLVLSEGRISLKIATEVSELTDSDTGALSSRAAETTIELPSGGSMMLAGLIKDTSREDVNGTPGLKNLPVLGALFRSRSYNSNQTELVVLVTPYIVNPVGGGELASPDQHFNPPTDRQSLLWGRLNKIYGTPGKHENGVYHGTVGYIIE